MTALAGKFVSRSAPSWSLAIYVAGDAGVAEVACQRFAASVGMCVTVTPTCFVYTGGRETGVEVVFRSYPRFPAAPQDCWPLAVELAEQLVVEMGQATAMVVGPTETRWITRRREP